MNAILTNWKSTLSGILSFLTTTGVVLLATGNSILNSKATTIVTIALALARAYMGLISKDPDKITSTDVAKATAIATKP